MLAVLDGLNFIYSVEKKPRGSRRRGGKENEVRAYVCVCVCVYVCCVHVCVFPPLVHSSRSGDLESALTLAMFDHSSCTDVAGAVSNQ